MKLHSYSCPYPEGCSCGASEYNRLISYIDKLERENKDLKARVKGIGRPSDFKNR